MKIAVTGGSGRVGMAVVRALVEAGHQVVNIDRKQSHDPLVRLVYCDVTKREQLQTVLADVEAVIHLAEIPSAETPFMPNEIYGHNTTAGSTVMQTAADVGVKRFIYTSSCQVYGMWGFPTVLPVKVPVDETHPLQPQNVYSLSKVANEGYARWLAKNSQMSIAIIRLPAVFSMQFQERWFKHKDQSTDPIEGFLSYLHPTDAGSAYLATVENLRPGCEAYHFAAADVCSTRPLREQLVARNPGYPPLPDGWPDFATVVDCSKAREHLGWQPKWSFTEKYQGWKATQEAAKA